MRTTRKAGLRRRSEVVQKPRDVAVLPVRRRLGKVALTCRVRDLADDLRWSSDIAERGEGLGVRSLVLEVVSGAAVELSDQDSIGDVASGGHGMTLWAAADSHPSCRCGPDTRPPDRPSPEHPGCGCC